METQQVTWSEYVRSKNMLLMALYGFAEIVQEAQQEKAAEDPRNRVMSFWLEKLLHQNKPLKFLKTLDQLELSPIPRPLQTLRAFMNDSDMFSTNSSLFSSTQRRILQSKRWHDLRLQDNAQLDRQVCMLTLGLSNSFMGYECTLQVGVTSNSTLQLGLSVGTTPVITMDGAIFRGSNRVEAESKTPPSVAIEYTLGDLAGSRVNHAYTYKPRYTTHTIHHTEMG